MKAYSGLQVFDSDAKQIVEITDRLPRILGQIRTNRLDGSVLVDTTGNFFYQIIRLTTQMADVPPSITSSGNALSWRYLDVYSARSDVIIVYGVY